MSKNSHSREECPESDTGDIPIESTALEEFRQVTHDLLRFHQDRSDRFEQRTMQILSLVGGIMALVFGALRVGAPDRQSLDGLPMVLLAVGLLAMVGSAFASLLVLSPMKTHYLDEGELVEDWNRQQKDPRTPVQAFRQELIHLLNPDTVGKVPLLAAVKEADDRGKRLGVAAWALGVGLLALALLLACALLSEW